MNSDWKMVKPWTCTNNHPSTTCIFVCSTRQSSLGTTWYVNIIEQPLCLWNCFAQVWFMRSKQKGNSLKKVFIEKKNTPARLKQLLRAKRNVFFKIYTHFFVTLSTEVRKFVNFRPKQAVETLPFLRSGCPLDGWMAAWLKAWAGLFKAWLS